MHKFFSFLQSHPVFLFFGFFFLVLMLWQISLSPSHDKNWREENQFLPTFSVQENTLLVKNFRDFWEQKNGETQKNWNTENFDLSEIQGMDFVISHFSTHHAIAHSFVVFRFADGKNLAVSMETRLPEGKKYSPFLGLLNQFEMLYVVGSERDLIGARIGKRKEEVYLYETTASPEMAKKILISFVQDINLLAEKPRFYNTLWHNCTTAIVGQVENALGKNIWWSFEHLLPGYADEKSLEMGFLKNEKNLVFAELQENSKISGKNIFGWEDGFSEKIREETKYQEFLLPFLGDKDGFVDYKNIENFIEKTGKEKFWHSGKTPYSSEKNELQRNDEMVCGETKDSCHYSGISVPSGFEKAWSQFYVDKNGKQYNFFREISSGKWFLFAGQEKFELGNLEEGAEGGIINVELVNGEIAFLYRKKGETDDTLEYFYKGKNFAEKMGVDSIEKMFEYRGKTGFIGVKNKKIAVYLDGKKVSEDFDEIRVVVCCAIMPYPFEIFENGTLFFMGRRGGEYFLAEIRLKEAI